ncbi:hypothetical protein H5119_09010 [Pseudoalteromonas sp. SG45-5]|uniref:Orphan protein n=1 Tax=Pseudoalteromonas aliena SW19 TaxID=1314866 RepID=A0ABR9E1M1_9GAMM|nr:MULTISPECIES: hypothetical protein [Pseudoalteromonas]MBB1385677.1 hypothetical protein [Pseudoalteromonas sp. SG45-5]MBB1393560.1 hypothetical protein [Pseudoalteromonas sp. SG44-4]MBE0359349.1 hypothetical protein [Pseudoalteromonas aliena SW19]
MPTTATFTRQDGLFIDANLHQFIEELLCTTATLKTTEVYQALATLVDEFGCTCRKNKHQANDTLEVSTLLNAYQQQNHPHCHVDAQTTEAVLDEYCCQVPAIIVVALMDTLSGTHCDEPSAHALYHRAAQLTNRPCMHSLQLANASAA